MKQIGKLQLLLLYPALLSVLYLLWVLLPSNGILGHDYFHYYIRILLGADFFWKNGFEVPYFTPYLSGGIPFIADPQSIFYSLPQLLSFWIEPIWATHFSFFVFFALGYWGVVSLSQRVFRYSIQVSHFIALLFLLNGFTFAHLYVGHITHLPFLLGPWLLIPFFVPHGKGYPLFRDSALVSTVILYCIFSGALHVLVSFMMMWFLLLPLVIHRARKENSVLSLIRVAGLSSLLIMVGAAGKLIPAILYSKHFYIHGIDSSGLSGLELLLRYLWFIPSKTEFYQQFGSWSFGAWEFVAFVSKITIPLALFSIVSLVKENLKSCFALFLITSLFLGLILLICAGTEFNQTIPFFRSYHNPLKILSSLILPLILLSGSGLESLFQKVKKHQHVLMLYMLVCVGVLAEFSHYADFFKKVPSALGFQYPVGLYQAVKRSQGLPEVKMVSSGNREDLSMITHGMTNLRAYEPLFGYRQERVFSQLTPGRTDLVLDSKFNLNHPGCFLYATSLGCEGWDRISVNEKSNFKSFSKGRAVGSWVPLWQKALDVAGILLFGFLFLTLVKIPHRIQSLERVVRSRWGWGFRLRKI